jgi:hypothetical protein
MRRVAALGGKRPAIPFIVGYQGVEVPVSQTPLPKADDRFNQVGDGHIGGEWQAHSAPRGLTRAIR